MTLTVGAVSVIALVGSLALTTTHHATANQVYICMDAESHAHAHRFLNTNDRFSSNCDYVCIPYGWKYLWDLYLWLDLKSNIFVSLIYIVQF